MDIFELYSMLCKKITQSAGGITGVSLGADGNSIDFTLASGSVDNVKFPQELTSSEKNIIAKFSVNASGKLLFDGKEITPDFLDITGAGDKFLADDGTYKTVSTGTTSYTKTEIDTKLADKADKTDLTTKADKTDLTNKANQAAVDAINADLGSETLKTTAATVKGGINELHSNALDTVSFSSDYKNIILNRKSGQNPVTIPLISIIAHCKLVELGDIDSTDIGNGKTLIYDEAAGKHKYVASAGTDELVKMDTSSTAKYLENLIDKQTIVNDNGILKVKKLDGQEATIDEINHLKGLTMNVVDLVSTFANGGVKVLNTPLNTASELSTMDRSAFIDGISYIVYVLADEDHAGAKTTYLIDKTNTTFFGNADSQRNFATNPIKLASEVTGKLGVSNIDVDALWNILTVDDTYKTDTVKDEPFGTHGAKAMYDELIAGIGGKVAQVDFDTHINDPNIHTSVSEKASYALKAVVGDSSKIDDTVINKILTIITNLDKKVNIADIIDNLISSDSNKPLSANQGKVLEDKKVNIDDIIDNLTSTDTDKPLSANQGKVLKDEVNLKANNSDVVKKTDITTTIDNISTDDEIPSAKVIFDRCIQGKKIDQSVINTYGTEILKYPLGRWLISSDSIAGKFTDLPIGISGHIDITSISYNDDNNPWSNQYAYRVYSYVPYSGSNYVRKLESGSTAGVITNDTGWQKVCTTKVADVGKTNITLSDTTNYYLNSGFYSVRNGICEVQITVTCTTPQTEPSDLATLPTPLNGTIHEFFVAYGGSVIQATISPDGNLCFRHGATGDGYFVRIVYLVAES